MVGGVGIWAVGECLKMQNSQVCVRKNKGGMGGNRRLRMLFAFVNTSIDVD